MSARWAETEQDRAAILKIFDDGARRSKENKAANDADKPKKRRVAAQTTQDDVALQFSEQHRDKLRFCHHVGKWHLWNGTIWKPEETQLAFDYARTICRNVGGKQLAKASDAGAVEKFARADRAFAVTSELWDRDPFLLGTPAGTVDLRTGELRPARQADYITQTTSVGPADDDCPLWRQFVDDATCKDEALRDFLQRWFGYCLTGDTGEHSLLFCYGKGGNGKSVMLNTISAIMGDYAKTASMDTFTASRGDKHSTDLAGLRGARIVLASETEEGRAWDEQRVKAITGGDPISVRFMRQDFFTYRPRFKPVLYGNHKPSLNNVDDAMRRRLKMAPFLWKPDQVIANFEELLRPEHPAILRWMIDGCLAWREQGLAPPDVVLAATEEYFAEQDLIARWADERCELDRAYGDRVEVLFSDWKTFANANGEDAGSAKRFKGLIEKLPGVKSARSPAGLFRGRGFTGIRVRPHDPNQDQAAQWWQE